MDGFLNINKPVGMTSYDVIRKCGRTFHGVKMGHLGTLDPNAGGVLPVAVGCATRLIEYVQDKTKEYRAGMIIGGVSDTQDAWGNVTRHHPEKFDSSRLFEVVKSFCGEIWQTPPMYSAVHYQGRRLYDLARQGIEVKVKPRLVIIKSIDIIDISMTDNGLPLVKIQVECSQGTYIRTLCHDIGRQLGTGAYMSELTRTRSGVFKIEDAFELDYILENGLGRCSYPLDYPLAGLPAVGIDQTDYCAVTNGNSISGDFNCPVGLARIYYGDKLVSIARCSRQGQAVLKPIKVFK